MLYLIIRTSCWLMVIFPTNQYPPGRERGDHCNGRERKGYRMYWHVAEKVQGHGGELLTHPSWDQTNPAHVHQTWQRLVSNVVYCCYEFVTKWTIFFSSFHRQNDVSLIKFWNEIFNAVATLFYSSEKFCVTTVIFPQVFKIYSTRQMCG